MSLLSFWDINSLMYHFVLYILKLTMKTCWFSSILYGIYPLCIYIMLWMPVILNFINTYLLCKIMTFRVEWTVQWVRSFAVFAENCAWIPAPTSTFITIITLIQWDPTKSFWPHQAPGMQLVHACKPLIHIKVIK